MWTYRIKYAKLGGIRFISHLDVMRALTRALNRADIPVEYSKGFNPRPKIIMGPALPLGCESKCEFADLVLARMLPVNTFHQRLAAAMPKGLDLLETDWATPSSMSLSNASSACYVVKLRGGHMFDDADTLVKEFLDKDSMLLERVRKDKRKKIDVRSLVADARLVVELESRWLQLEILMGDRGSCSASEVAQAIFGLPPETAKSLKIVRTDIKFANRAPKAG